MAEIAEYECEPEFDKFAQFSTQDMPTLSKIGFEETFVSKTKIGFSHEQAVKLLDSFISKRIKQYKKARDYPSVAGVSYLSVHNRFGTLSIRELFRAALKVRTKDAEIKENIDTWISELIWRDFYFQILYNFPRVAYEPFNNEYKDFPWENDMEKFQKWCDGETGYPIVDAAMKQMNQTGYMHNRLRMVTASFLTKHLLVDYRLGEQYFAAKLLDYDLSANNGGWQWAASTGCDAQPYFRVFNPTLQSEKFDPQAKFIKKMLPVLAQVDAKYLHNPSEYEEELADAGVILGEDYPWPIVNHKEARQHTLDLFKEFVTNKL
jgi:deoxyribodipyrimidine photo-lyase